MNLVHGLRTMSLLLTEHHHNQRRTPFLFVQGSESLIPSDLRPNTVYKHTPSFERPLFPFVIQLFTQSPEEFMVYVRYARTGRGVEGEKRAVRR